MLAVNRVNVKLVSVVDNNDIDREVHQFKPDIVIIEAFWVVPEKFDVLQKLHPKVKWIIRGHSDLPFFANEGVAVEWTKGYVTRKNVFVAFNSTRITSDFQKLFGDKIVFLPNFYPLRPFRNRRPNDGVLRIGCFGALRPMKNQLLQAVAAVRFADKIGEPLEFHINSTRCEHKGENVLKNLRALFAGTRHKLVEHGWLGHEEFLKLIGTMDYVLAVSFSETFCITAADAVATHTPLICSAEIPWATKISIVPPDSSDAIVEKLLEFSHGWKFLARFINRIKLFNYSVRSVNIWLEFLKRLSHGK